MSQQSDGRPKSASRHSAKAPDFSFETSQPFPPLESESAPQTQTQTQTTGDRDRGRGPLEDNDYREEDAAGQDGTFSGMSNNAQAAEAEAEAEVEIEVEDDADFQSQYSFENASSVGDGDSMTISDEIEEEVEGEEEEEEGQDPNEDDNNSNNNNFAMHRPFMQSTGSLHGPNAFAPPFYNRPPTPLPPSPSLTSLLRPPFSTTTSRPTTPDTSDADTPNDTEAAVAKSARHATTVPRASPKVPTYEYYGFVLYLASSFAFLIYLLWSYLPSPFLHQLGIYYYPNRWWSLAIPSYLVMTIVYIYVALASYNTGYLTLPMNSIENIVDEAANIAVIDGKGRRRPGGSEKMKPGAATSQTMGAVQNRKPNSNWNWKDIWSEGTDAVMDIPVGGVCEVLYGQDREREPEEVEQSQSESHSSSHSHEFSSTSSSSSSRGRGHGHGHGHGVLRSRNQGGMRW
ncbi:hypothetical protein VTN77DRAFT_7070 [Rasamsonia byssochlamydoides]|uniref:uncharacterized protein n=1 Tax=Rasamsonia byssochlamydoides TaxID=89139 RepID=UPI00374386CD